MNLDFISSATAKELQQFKSVCNQLLSRTFVVRTLYRPGRERLNNPDYTFLSIHFEAVRDYLSLLDWDLRHDEANGCFYVINTDEANRLILSKRETAILLALRMLYDESQERLGLEQDALCTVREVLEKVVTDYAILPAKPNMDEFRRAMLVFENHAVIQRIDRQGGRTILEHLPTGSVFGEMLMFENVAGDSITVVAAESCRVWFMSAEHLTRRCEKACTHHSRLVENMFHIMTGKAAALSERVEVLSRRSIREKLLCYFGLQTGGDDCGSFHLPFTLSALADYISADRSAMMRELRKMKEEHLVDIDRGQVTLHHALA